MFPYSSQYMPLARPAVSQGGSGKEQQSPRGQDAVAVALAASLLHFPPPPPRSFFLFL